MVEPLSGGVGGWRARLGLVTANDAVNYDECWQYLPAGVSLVQSVGRSQKRWDSLDLPNASHANMTSDCRYKPVDYHEQLRIASG